MLIVAGTFEVVPDQRDAFIASRTAQMRESRAETGCLDYVMCADPVEANRVYLFERWETSEDLAVHIQRLRALPPSSDPLWVVPISSDVQQFEIGSVGPVGG